jgi:hypothetical protein
MEWKIDSFLSEKFGVLTEGNLNAFISEKFAERKEHLKKAVKEYFEKYDELVPKLKETGTKMPREMELIEHYVNLENKVDNTLIHKIQAELGHPSISAKVELLEAFLALLIAIQKENETFFQILASKWDKDVGFY